MPRHRRLESLGIPSKGAQSERQLAGMHCILRHAVTLLCLGPLLAQQETSAQRFAAQRAQLVTDTTAQLQSPDIAQVAWGAYAVAQFRLQDCAPAVRKALAHRPWRDASSDRCATLALLDALIQTDAVVPAEELAPHLDEGAPTILLMAREPEQNREPLLRRFTALLGTCRASPEWIACGNLLAAMRDPAFVLALLRSPSQCLLTVCDPGDEPGPIYWGSGRSCYRFDVPKDFPPIARYELDIEGSRGAVVVAPGPQPVYSGRSFYRPSGLHGSSFHAYQVYRSARCGWLEQMLDEASQPLVAAIDRPRTIVWRNDELFRKELDRCRHDYETSWRALVAACGAKKLVALDPALEPLPALRMVGLDMRKDQKVPLPDGVGDLPW